jgi:hypothetical protein
MKESFNVLSLSAGKFIDEKSGEVRVFSSLTYVDKSVSDIIETDQIKVGQQHVKMKINFDNDNKIARDLALSGLIPGNITLDLEMSVIKNTPTLSVVGFENLPSTSKDLK